MPAGDHGVRDERGRQCRDGFRSDCLPRVHRDADGSTSSPSPGDNVDRWLATTAFVLAEITAIGAGVVTGNPGGALAVTLAINDVTGAGGAPLASPVFTGVPAGPTAAPGVSTTQLATCAFVMAAIPAPSASAPLINGAASPGTLAAWSRGDHVHPTDTSRAAATALASYLPLAGGTLTGVLNVQTETQIAWNGPNGSTFENLNTSVYLQIDNGGNFAYVGGIGGAKTGGGTWAAPSGRAHQDGYRRL